MYSVSTSEFHGDDNGNVRALRLVEVKFEGGKLVEVEGTEQEIPAELVLLAMGFVGPEQDTVVAQLGVTLDERGNIARDHNYATDVEGVFVAGDAGGPVTDRLGHRRGSRLRGRCGRVPVRLDQAAPPDSTHRTPDDGLTGPGAGPFSGTRAGKRPRNRPQAGPSPGTCWQTADQPAVSSATAALNTSVCLDTSRIVLLAPHGHVWKTPTFSRRCPRRPDRRSAGPR